MKLMIVMYYQILFPIRTLTLLLTKCSVLVLALSCQSPSYAALAVIDSAALSESISQRIMTIESWARDNLNQVRQIQELLSGNNILTNTQKLMDLNYAMDFKASWEQISALQEQSLALLYASKSVWEEYGSAQQYYAAFHKAQAWKNCMQSHSCHFDQVLNSLDESTISQSLQAYRQAEAMNDKLNAQVAQLKNLVTESELNHSQAGTLDALSKINGVVASSMVDLNNQMAQLTKLKSHEMAAHSNAALAHKSYLEEILRYQSTKSKALPSHLPNP